jgi:trehalose 6-phosphate phosphatase
VFLDYDGTLAPIVLDPDAALPSPGVVDLLVELTERLGRVVVVSGRPVSFLARHLPPAVDVVGLYGLEERRSGVLAEHPMAAGWRSVVDDVAMAAVETAPTGVEVEHKGLSLTLHVRRHSDQTDAVRAWAETAAASSGLRLRDARRSVELHPPVQVDKGTVVDSLLGGLTAACFVGDDAGDLPAFVALARFAAAGGTALRVVVDSDEVPDDLIAVADVRVDGPLGALEFLRSLLA